MILLPIRWLHGRAALAILLLVSLSTSTAHSADNELRLRVTGLESDRGSMVCGLFTAETWLRAGGIGATAKIVNGEAICVYTDIAPGTYGISAYHDENGNGKLDSNFIRIPKEGTATSNSARGKFGPPKFKNARFDYDGTVLELTDKMQYRN